MAESNYRAFIGMPVVGESAEIIESWLPSVPMPGPDHHLELSPRENWHVTLHFFGQSIDHNALFSVWKAVCHELKSLSSITVTPESLVGLPMYHSNAWVVALELCASMLELQLRVTRPIQSAGLPIERRPYFPHVTLWRPRARDKLDLPQVDIELPALTLHSVALYQSHQGEDGSKYKILDQLELK